MPEKTQTWLKRYVDGASATDRLQDRTDHLLLLSAGLMGEAGSILAEIKKMGREGKAYPAYQQRLVEEIGDFLWYFCRVSSAADDTLFDSLPSNPEATKTKVDSLIAALELGASVGAMLGLISKKRNTELRAALQAIWSSLTTVASNSGITVEEAANANLRKIQSRWPTDKRFLTLFDESCQVEEQIPRRLSIDFVERTRGDRTEVLLRCNGIGIGDRLTDNIADADGYRYHDIFHIANAVFLGWSPVVRALLRCKRKSQPTIDENQDGARAAVVEEAVAAIVFSRAKRMDFFKDMAEVDYDLLKSIRDFVAGFEVEHVPLWQWERSILEGFRVFRALRSGNGGRISWDLSVRALNYVPL